MSEEKNFLEKSSQKGSVLPSFSKDGDVEDETPLKTPKKKFVMSEARLENLRKGREKRAENVRKKKELEAQAKQEGKAKKAEIKKRVEEELSKEELVKPDAEISAVNEESSEDEIPPPVVVKESMHAVRKHVKTQKQEKPPKVRKNQASSTPVPCDAARHCTLPPTQHLVLFI